MARSHSVAREMTLFRVLTEEESRSVKRWQAPSLASVDNSVKVASQSSSPPPTLAEDAGADVPASNAAETNSDEAPRNDVGDTKKSDETLNLEEAPSDVVAAASMSADMLQSSYDEGYSVGFAEGNAAAHESDSQNFSKVLKNLSAEQILHDEALLEDILDLVKVTTGLIVKEALKVDASIVKDWVVEGLKRLPTASTASVVRLHPLDAARVKQLVDPDLADRIVEDAELSQGDCHIESGASSVRTGVYEQICRLSANQLSDSHADVSDS